MRRIYLIFYFLIFFAFSGLAQMHPTTGLKPGTKKNQILLTVDTLGAKRFVYQDIGFTISGDTLYFTDSLFVYLGSYNTPPPLQLWTETGANIYRNSSIGIGGNSPTAVLDIQSGKYTGNGTILIGGDLNLKTRTNLIRKIATIKSPHFDNSEEPVLGLSFDNFATQNIINIGGQLGTQSNTATEVRLWTTPQNNNTTSIERMNINNIGRIRFNAYGQQNFTGAISSVLSVNNNGELIEPTPAALTSWLNIQSGLWDTDNTNIWRLNNKVAVGLSSPISRLHVRGTKDNLTSINNFQMGFIIDDSTPMATGVGGGISFRSLRLSGNNNTYSTLAAIDSYKEGGNGDYKGSLRFFTANSSTGYPIEHMRLNSYGELGLGTTSPTELLHIKGAAPSIRLEDVNQTAPAGNFSIRSLNDKLTLFRGVYGVSAVSLLEAQSNKIVTYGLDVQSVSGGVFNGVTGVKLQPNARIGVGLDSPSHNLHFKGVNQTIRFEDTNQVAPSGEYLLKNNFDRLSFMRGVDGISANELLSISNSGVSAYDLKIENNSGGYLNGNIVAKLSQTGSSYINNGGKFGVGTASPSVKLEIDNPLLTSVGSISSYTVGISNSGVSRLTIGAGSTANYIQTWASKPLHINELGNNTVLNSNSGNVGIGTPAPTQKLDVNGRIRMRTGAAAGFVPVSDGSGVLTWTNPNTLFTNDGNGIYTGNGVLTANTVVTMGNNDLSYDMGGGRSFSLDGVLGTVTITNTGETRMVSTGTLSQIKFSNTSTASNAGNVGLLGDRMRVVNFEPGGTVELAVGGQTDLTIDSDGTVISNSDFKTEQKAIFEKAVIKNSLFDQGTISVDQDDYNPVQLNQRTTLAFNATGDFNLSGIMAQEEGFTLTLINYGNTGNITLVGNGAGSSSTNRFASLTNYVLGPRESVDIQYFLLNGGKWFIKGH